MKRINREGLLYWTEISILFLLGLFLAILIATASKIIFSKWDMIGFWGSITGGILTLVGVMLTIRYNNKVITLKKEEDFIDSLPKKIRTIDLIRPEIEIIYMSMENELINRDNTLLTSTAYLALLNLNNNYEAWLKNLALQTTAAIMIDKESYVILTEIEQEIRGEINQYKLNMDNEHFVTYSQQITSIALQRGREISVLLKRAHGQLGSKRNQLMKVLFEKNRTSPLS